MTRQRCVLSLIYEDCLVENTWASSTTRGLDFNLPLRAMGNNATDQLSSQAGIATLGEKLCTIGNRTERVKNLTAF